MNRLLLIFLFFVLALPAQSQIFLDSYSKYRSHNIKSLRSGDLVKNGFTSKMQAKKLRKMELEGLKLHLNELDTIFSSYEKSKGFNFNKADSINIIYQTPDDTPLSDIIIWSGKDTISYSQEFRNLAPNKYKRVTVYKPFRYALNKLDGYKEINNRDTLITLIAKRNFDAAVKLAEGQSGNGGTHTTIVVASKENGKYMFKRLYIQPFFFKPIYRKK